MNKTSIKFLEKLMKTPSPSGYEEEARKVWRNHMELFSDTIQGDVHGNSIAVINEQNAPRIMLAGHIDEIAFQVKYISKEGYIYLNSLGGFDTGIIPGRKVRIHTKKGDVLGVVGRKAIHLLKQKDREKATKLTDICVDIGAKDKKEVEKLIEIGDPMTYDNNFEKLRNGLYTSRAFDDKIGAFIVAEVMKNVHKKKAAFKASLYSVATVQEEVGLRGAYTSAYGINPDIGIAIDVTHATDTPDVEAKEHGDIKIGKGATITRGPNINSRVFDLLVKTARKKKIPFQIEAEGRPTGTDANAIQISRAGVATALISIPCRYMHTFTEVVSIDDVQSSIDMLTAFCLGINDKHNFTL